RIVADAVVGADVDEEEARVDDPPHDGVQRGGDRRGRVGHRSARAKATRAPARWANPAPLPRGPRARRGGGRPRPLARPVGRRGGVRPRLAAAPTGAAEVNRARAARWWQGVLLLLGAALFAYLIADIGLDGIRSSFETLSWRLLVVLVFPCLVFKVFDTLGW